MTITGRCLVLCGLLTALTACGESDKDYRAMPATEICELLPVDKVRDLMKDITDERLDASEERSVDLPACRYGSGEGKPYLRISVHQSSRLEEGGDVVSTTVADQKALQEDSGGSCSVFVPLAENLYLLTIVEAWDPAKDPCPVAHQAAGTAYPKLTA